MASIGILPEPATLSSAPSPQCRNLKILSLDGGGIRGLSSLMILEDIFRSLNHLRSQRDPDVIPLEPCDYFDLIGGTSTGGIIALMLGRLRMSIEQCKNQYLKLGKEVFTPRKGIGHGTKFDAGKFERVLKRIICLELMSPEGVPGREDAPLKDPRGTNCCKTVVYTVSYLNANSTEAESLRTYRTPQDAARPFTIWQAARATAAAPTFFDPLVVPADNYSQWIDGGFNVNNPAERIFDEVKQIWGEQGRRFDLERIGMFLTLGTGVGGTVSLRGGFWNDLTTRIGAPETLIRGLVKTKFDTEGPHQRLLKEFNETLETSKRYHRFNVDSGLRDIDFFAYKKVSDIAKFTEGYLMDQNTQQRLNNCISQAADLLEASNTTDSPKSLSEHSLPALIDLLKTNEALLKPVEDYDDSKYFYHLTEQGMSTYEAIYARLPKGIEGYIGFKALLTNISEHGASPERLDEIWSRMRGGLDARMPRNMLLNILYMVHVECLDPRFQDHRPEKSSDGRWGTTDARFITAQAFGNWVVCRFHEDDAWCGRSWSYANHQWGMCRGLQTDVECDLWMFHRDRLLGQEAEDGFHRVTVQSGSYEKAKAARMECRKRFLEHLEYWKI